MQALQTLVAADYPLLSSKRCFFEGELAGIAGSHTGPGQTVFLHRCPTGDRGPYACFPASKRLLVCFAASKPAGGSPAGTAHTGSSVGVSGKGSFAPLPLPSRSLFPGPLQFLWFRDESKAQPSGSGSKPNAGAVLAPAGSITNGDREAKEGESGDCRVGKSIREGISGSAESGHEEDGDDGEGEDESPCEIDSDQGESVLAVKLPFNREEGRAAHQEGESRQGENAPKSAISLLPEAGADSTNGSPPSGDLGIEPVPGSHVATSGKESHGKGAEGASAWRPHMLGFHSLWRGFRAHLRAAAASRVQQMEQKVQEKLQEKGAEILADAAKKPARASAWAMGALLDWKTEQQQKDKEGTAVGAPQVGVPAGANLEAIRGSSKCQECGACSVDEVVPGGDPAAARGAAYQEVPRLRVAHTAESMQPFLDSVRPSDLRKLALMAVLCDMAYTIPEIMPSEMYRRYRLRLVTSSLELKARQAAQEKQDKEKAAASGSGTDKMKGSAGGEKAEAEGGGEKAGAPPGGGLSPATAYAFAAAAAAYLQSQSLALLPKGGEQKAGEDKIEGAQKTEEDKKEGEQRTKEDKGEGGAEAGGRESEHLQAADETVTAVGADAAVRAAEAASMALDMPRGSPALEGAGGGTNDRAAGVEKEGRLVVEEEDEVKTSMDGQSFKEGEGGETGRVEGKEGGSADYSSEVGKDKEVEDGEKDEGCLVSHVSEGGELVCVTRSDVVDSLELSEGAEREAEELLRLRREREERDGKLAQKGGKDLAGKEDEQLAMVAAPVAAVVAVASSRAGKGASAEAVCPCEWFSCDEPLTTTRYFVIQGSDSLASWQTNVSFDPVPFEDPSLGVVVHRGIYDAAQALYATLLPAIQSFVAEHGGSTAKIQFTGHSLGGSLATLLHLMLRLRGAVPPETLLPIYTFGSPSIMCGGDHLLDTLGMPRSHLLQVMLHRDLVPRAFACDYPDHVAEVLRRMSASFRDHPCLLHQRLMYAPMGTMVVLQPDQKQAPPHPLLPAGAGLYHVRHPEQNNAELPHQRRRCHGEVRAAQRAILNSPHPLEILADPGAYGTEGSISRDHDPRSYARAIRGIIRAETRRMRRLQRQQRRRMWWPLVGAELAALEGRRWKGDAHAASAHPRVTSRADGGEGRQAAVVSRLGDRTRRQRCLANHVSAGGASPSSQVPAGSGGFSSQTLYGGNDWKRRCRSLIASQHVELGMFAILTWPMLSTWT